MIARSHYLVRISIDRFDNIIGQCLVEINTWYVIIIVINNSILLYEYFNKILKVYQYYI